MRRRTVRLDRGQGVQIDDQYELDAPPQSLTLSLLTACTVDADTPGVIALLARSIADERESGSATLRYDGSKFSAAVESIPIDDMRLKQVWGQHLFRIVLTATNPAQSDRWSLRVTR